MEEESFGNISIVSSVNVWEESDLDVNASLDDSFRTLVSVDAPPPPLAASTPSRGANFAVPKAPVKQCPICKRVLKTEQGFLTHTNNHEWKKAASQKPSLEATSQHLSSKTKDILGKIVEKCDNQELGTLLNQVVSEFEHQEYSDFFKETVEIVTKGLCGTSIVLPNSVRGILQKSLSEYLSSQANCDKLKKTFPVECSVSVFSLFVFDYLKALVDCSIIYLCQSMSSASASVPKNCSSGDFDHHVTHQVLHHIAGWAFRKQIKAQQQYPKNERLKRMRNCIMERFVEQGSVSVVNEKDKKFWTSVINRKSLLFVKDEAFLFFVYLGKLLQLCEDIDGVKHENVMKKIVCDKSILSAWTSAVGNALDEADAFSLMIKIVRSITNTYGRGLMLRKMNAKANSTKAMKASTSVSHRARLL